MNKDFEKYINKKVWCKTEELAKEFLRLAHNNGWTWIDGDSLLEGTTWEMDEKYTCYFVWKNKKITYSKIRHNSTNEFIEYEPLCVDNDISPEETKRENKMNNEERVNLVFETISKIVGFEVKPNKDFYIWANGEKTKYHIRSDLTLMIEGSKGYYVRSDYTILPILKGGYKLEEIKETLLTDEEKEFLRNFNFDTVELLTRYDKDEDVALAPCVILKLDYNVAYITSHKFEGLEMGKKYTREELGL